MEWRQWGEETEERKGRQYREGNKRKQEAGREEIGRWNSQNSERQYGTKKENR